MLRMLSGRFGAVFVVAREEGGEILLTGEGYEGYGAPER